MLSGRSTQIFCFAFYSSFFLIRCSVSLLLILRLLTLHGNVPLLFPLYHFMLSGGIVFISSATSFIIVVSCIVLRIFFVFCCLIFFGIILYSHVPVVLFCPFSAALFLPSLLHIVIICTVLNCLFCSVLFCPALYKCVLCNLLCHCNI